MSTTTLTPNGTTSAGGWTVTGAASAHAALSDGSDASYIDSATQTGTAKLGFTTTAVPALAQVRSVTPRIRVSQAVGSTLLEILVVGSSQYRTAVDYNRPPSAVTSYTLLSPAGPSIGGSWTQEDLDAFEVHLRAGLSVPPSADDILVYKVDLDVVINEAPVATVATPAVNTVRPSVAWTYSDPEGDLQERYQVKVFSAAQYGAGGFDPSTSAATYDSGQVLDSVALAHVVAVDLTNATVYKAYVRVADAGSGGRFGAWALSSSWTVAVDAPAVPTITALAEPASARVLLTLGGRTNMLSENQSSLETDTTGWAAVSNCTVARSTAQAAHGAASLAITATAGGDAQAATPAGVTPVTVGQTYTAIASFRAASTARTVRVELATFTAGGSLVGLVFSTAIADATGSWTQVSATGVAPATAAYVRVFVTVVAAGASEVHYVDKISVAPGSSTPWTLGGRVASANSNAIVVVERSTDAGATWAAARVARSYGFGSTENSVGTDPAGLAIAYDYETPPGSHVLYRAKASVVLAGATLVSEPSPTANATMTIERPWLKDPLDPDANVAPAVVFPARSSRTERQSVKRPLGRTRPVVLADTIEGEAGVLEIRCFEGADFARLDAIRAAQHTLLLHTDWDDPRYIRLGPERSSELVVSDGVERYRKVTIAYVEVDRPAGVPSQVVDAVTGYAGAYGGGL